jgi:hypothetical protein
MLDPIQYEFLFLFTTLADPEPGAGSETSIFRLQLRPKVPAPQHCFPDNKIEGVPWNISYYSPPLRIFA